MGLYEEVQEGKQLEGEGEEKEGEKSCNAKRCGCQVERGQALSLKEKAVPGKHGLHGILIRRANENCREKGEGEVRGENRDYEKEEEVCVKRGSCRKRGDCVGVQAGH